MTFLPDANFLHQHWKEVDTKGWYHASYPR